MPAGMNPRRPSAGIGSVSEPGQEWEKHAASAGSERSTAKNRKRSTVSVLQVSADEAAAADLATKAAGVVYRTYNKTKDLTMKSPRGSPYS